MCYYKTPIYTWAYLGYKRPALCGSLLVDNTYRILIISAMNEINWKPKALKQVEKIKETSTRQNIYTEVQALANFPSCNGIKKLVNHAYSYRLRVGNYRVFFEFDGGVQIIYIEEVKKRNESTY
jgi:mRNA interferase RelE/StbE